MKINIAKDILTNLKRRLKNTRWPDEIVDSGWEYGTNLSYLKELVSYWETDLTGESRKSTEQLSSIYD